jgi:hypothetical protein
MKSSFLSEYNPHEHSLCYPQLYWHFSLLTFHQNHPLCSICSNLGLLKLDSPNVSKYSCKPVLNASELLCQAVIATIHLSGAIFSMLAVFLFSSFHSICVLSLSDSLLTFRANFSLLS